jgi:hypothetical protein
VTLSVIGDISIAQLKSQHKGRSVYFKTLPCGHVREVIERGDKTEFLLSVDMRFEKAMREHGVYTYLDTTIGRLTLRMEPSEVGAEFNSSTDFAKHWLNSPPLDELPPLLWRDFHDKNGQFWKIWEAEGDEEWCGSSTEDAWRAVCKARPDLKNRRLLHFLQYQEERKVKRMKAASPTNMAAGAVTGPGLDVTKSKFIIVEPQAVEVRTHRFKNLTTGEYEVRELGMTKPWIARPEGKLSPYQEGDTPEEAVDALKMGSYGYEDLPHVVVGVKVEHPTYKPAVNAIEGGRVERTIE